MKLRFLFCGLLAGLAGCATSPPATDLTDSTPTIIPDQWSQELAVPSGRTLTLRQGLGDPQLAALLDLTLTDHSAIQAALARMRQAEARARLAGAALQPDASLALERSYQEFDAGELGIVETDRYNLTLSASWEIDLWGSTRQRQSAAIARWEAAGFTAGDVQLSTLGNLAKGWFLTVEAKIQSHLAEQIQQNHLSQVEALERRFQAGLVDADVLGTARAQAALAAANLQQRLAQLDRQRRDLQVLATVYPDGSLSLPDTLPALPEPVAAGLPSDLLERRPDLRSAERRLAAASAEETSARRNRLPVFQLTGSVGRASDDLSDLLSGGQVLRNFVAGLTAPLLSGGRLRAERELALAQHEELAAEFTLVVLRAFGEVETALRREEILRLQLNRMEEALLESQRQSERALSMFERGIGDLLQLLEAENNAINAAARLTETHHQILQNRIDLIIALGGDMGSFSKDLNRS